MNQINNIYSEAIQNKKMLRFRYDGHERFVEPYCIGMSTAGNEIVLCYQTGGGSNSGHVPGWHSMTTFKIDNLQTTQISFIPRSDYNGPGKNFIDIFNQI